MMMMTMIIITFTFASYAGVIRAQNDGDDDNILLLVVVEAAEVVIY